jgi:hypothetical protein
MLKSEQWSVAVEPIQHVGCLDQCCRYALAVPASISSQLR